MIVIGSHVQKTIPPAGCLKELDKVEFIEFHSIVCWKRAASQDEVKRWLPRLEEDLPRGITCAVFTSRQRLDVNSEDKEDELRIATRIYRRRSLPLSEPEVPDSFLIAREGSPPAISAPKGLGSNARS
jgi:hypothetical protein